MPTYVTKIRNEDGSTREKVLSVPDASQLSQYLSRLDGFVVECQPYEEPISSEAAPTLVGPSAKVRSPQAARYRLSPRDLVLFSWYLHTLLNAGVSLVKALQIVTNQLEEPTWKIVLPEVIASLERGESLADAFSRYPGCFPHHYLHLVEVGEVSGQLDPVLRELAIHGEKQLETRSKIRGALTYPAVLFFACSSVLTFLVAFVIPRIAKMFDNAKVELPIFTKVLVHGGQLLRDNIFWFLGALVVAALGVVIASRTPPGQLARSWIALHVPLFGKLYQKFVLAGYCRTLSLLHHSGVSLLVSLDLARQGVRNLLIRDFLGGVEKNLEEGAELGIELARCPYIPEMVSSMITVGEETGRLNDMLEKVTHFYERDIDQTVTLLPKLLEPIVIVTMTAVVGLIATSVFVPLSQLTSGIG